MKKTTVYLPDDLKAAINRAAARQRISEAEVIRRAIRNGLDAARLRPVGGLFTGAVPTARRVDELLDAFGEQ